MSIVALVIIVALVFMEASGKIGEQGYGEFKNKFKGNWVCKVYIALTIVYRILIGLYLATQSHSIESTTIVVIFTICLLLYIHVNLPFLNVYQNYRSSFIHLTMFVTLLVANYYRSMKSTTPLEITATIYAPAILELALILCCIVVSFFVLVY